MSKKVATNYNDFVKSLSPKEKKKFDEQYRDLLLSEMILAAMEEDNISVRKLAKAAGVSPTIVQSMRSGIKKDFNVGSLFKILRGLGCNVIIERNGHQTLLNLSQVNK